MGRVLLALLFGVVATTMIVAMSLQTSRRTGGRRLSPAAIAVTYLVGVPLTGLTFWFVTR